MVETIASWGDYSYTLISDCAEPIHVWLLISFFLLILLRGTHLAAFAQVDDTLPWFWRSMIVLAPCHCQAFFAMVFVYYTYWLLKGTIWYYALVSTPTVCFDPREFSIWIVFLYAVVVAYVTLGLIGLMSLCKERVNEEHYQRLLEQYQDEEAPPRVRDRHWDETGLSPRSILNQPMREVAIEEDSRHTCSICLEDIRHMQRIRELRCGHLFHIKCIDEWFVQRSECPNCNQSFRQDAVVVF